MPRVLIAGFTALPGPHRIGVQLRHIMRALLRRHRVDVLVLRRGEQAYVERAGNARILRVPVPDGEIRGRVEAFRRALRRQLEGADYDIVHFADGWAGQTVLELRERFKFAAVYDAGRSPLTGTLPLDHAVVSELERAEAQCAAASDLVLAPTEPARQYLASLGPPQRVHVVAPGVDVDLFDWDVGPPADSGPPVILYAGTVSQGRGIQVLLGAMLELLRRCEAELVIAGRAGREFRQNLSSTLRELGLDRRVKFGGVIDHSRVPDLIARSTICVVPGAPEVTSNRLAIYPTKLLEYLACQRPVVAPRRSSVSLLLRDGQTGLLFEPGQPSDLADKLYTLINDASLRGRLARAGYELVRRSHSASSTRRELRQAYDWLGSISPWRERFASAVDNLPEAEVRLPGPDDTEAGAVPRGDSDPMQMIDSAEIIVEASVDSGSLEVLAEPVGEVTRVEVSPLLGESDTKSTSLFGIDESKGDDWVVEDSNTRPVEQSGVLGEVPSDTSERAQAPPKSGPLTSMDSSFVAGEIRGEGDTTDEIVIGANPLAAEAPLLGTLDEDEKTRLFALPPELSHVSGAETLRTHRALNEPEEDDQTQIATFVAPARPQQPAKQTAKGPPLGQPQPPPTPRTSPPPTPQQQQAQRPRASRVADSESPSTKPFPRLPSPPEGAAGPERE